MINKKIHYCWFGDNPLDAKAQKCIESWKKYFPEYEIIQWNEYNFDITQIEFMEKAYKKKKWAFVSDVARLIVIYENGGIYFDTDVEVIKEYDDILDNNTRAFMGMEREGFVSTGLGFGAEKGHPFLKKNIELYKNISFEEYETHISDITCPILTTKLLEELGFKKEDKVQVINGIKIYPSSYFAPIDYITGRVRKKKNTHSIHWYSSSWQDEDTKNEQRFIRRLRLVFGTNIAETIYGILSCLHDEGISHYISHRVKKIIFRR